MNIFDPGYRPCGCFLYFSSPVAQCPTIVPCCAEHEAEWVKVSEQPDYRPNLRLIKDLSKNGGS